MIKITAYKYKFIFGGLLILLLGFIFLNISGKQEKNLNNNDIYYTFSEEDGDIGISLEVINSKELIIKNPSKNLIHWVLTSQESSNQKNADKSMSLAETVDGVINSGTCSTEESKVFIEKGYYHFYAYCNDGSPITMYMNLKNKDERFILN